MQRQGDVGANLPMAVIQVLAEKTMQRLGKRADALINWFNGTKHSDSTESK